jgi:hypothetical protein
VEQAESFLSVIWEIILRNSLGDILRWSRQHSLQRFQLSIAGKWHFEVRFLEIKS